MKNAKATVEWMVAMEGFSAAEARILDDETLSPAAKKALLKALKKLGGAS